MFPDKKIFSASVFKFLREDSQNTFLNTKNPPNFWYFFLKSDWVAIFVSWN